MTIENTGKIMFENDVAQWYIAQGDHWEGPLSASEVYQKVVSQEISWAHFVWKPGKSAWARICDLKEFHAVVPPLPGKDLTHQVKEASKPPQKLLQKVGTIAPEQKVWYLHFGDAQYGPFTRSEIVQVIKSGKVNDVGAYAWCDGMADWDRLENIETFQEFFAAPQKKMPPPAPSQAAVEKNLDEKGQKTSDSRIIHEDRRFGLRVGEKRQAPRRPLVARIMMTQGDLLITAMCRDISIGGMQVLTDKIPGPVGTQLKMNVSSTEGKTDASVGASKIEPFVADGVIVRILEDGRGFSFRFNELSTGARRAIETYIQGI
jgi:hypothetical protein